MKMTRQAIEEEEEDKGMESPDPPLIHFITGAAGFIGYFLCKSLLEKGYRVVGFDNINDYYDANLKQERLNRLKSFESFTFIKGDISDKNALPLSVYRIRQIVNDLKSKNLDLINKLSQEMSGYIHGELSSDPAVLISRKIRIKTASKHKPVFWRASKS